jgi:hypothetical protein
MYLKIRSYKKKGSQPKNHKNKALRRKFILLISHEIGFSNGNLPFVSVRSGC